MDWIKPPKSCDSNTQEDPISRDYVSIPPAWQTDTLIQYIYGVCVFAAYCLKPQELYDAEDSPVT